MLILYISVQKELATDKANKNRILSDLKREKGNCCVSCCVADAAEVIAAGIA